MRTVSWHHSRSISICGLLFDYGCKSLGLDWTVCSLFGCALLAFLNFFFFPDLHVLWSLTAILKTFRLQNFYYEAFIVSTIQNHTMWGYWEPELHINHIHTVHLISWEYNFWVAWWVVCPSHHARVLGLIQRLCLCGVSHVLAISLLVLLGSLVSSHCSRTSRYVDWLCKNGLVSLPGYVLPTCPMTRTHNEVGFFIFLLNIFNFYTIIHIPPYSHHTLWLGCWTTNRKVRIPVGPGSCKFAVPSK